MLFTIVMLKEKNVRKIKYKKDFENKNSHFKRKPKNEMGKGEIDCIFYYVIYKKQEMF